MNKNTEIHLNERDVEAAIKDYVKHQLSAKEEIDDLTFFTGVHGDYDRGNAEEYVDKVIVSIKKKDE